MLDILPADHAAGGFQNGAVIVAVLICERIGCFFHQILHYFETGELIGKPPLEEVVEMILRHARMQIEFKGEEIAMREMRKHSAWYTAGYHNSARLRGRLNEVSTYQELEDLFRSLV